MDYYFIPVFLLIYNSLRHDSERYSRVRWTKLANQRGRFQARAAEYA